MPAANALLSAAELERVVPAWRARASAEGPLTPEELEQFFTEGWFVKRGLLNEAQLTEVEKDITLLIDEVVEDLRAEGRCENGHEAQPFDTRLHAIAQDGSPDAPMRLQMKGMQHCATSAASTLSHCSSPAVSGGGLMASVRNLWSCDAMLDVAEQVLGTPEIHGTPVHVLRCKTPSSAGHNVPWHQDNAYVLEEAWSKLQLTAWVPLIDANKENGCLELAPRGHLSGKTATHVTYPQNMWYNGLSTAEIESTLGVASSSYPLTAACDRGDVLFFSNLLPHRSTPNLSQKCRFSVDLRWQHVSEPNGMGGQQASVLMRSKERPKKVMRTEAWADRTIFDDLAAASSKALSAEEEVQNAAAAARSREFGTPLGGPWIHRWWCACCSCCMLLAC